MPIYLRHLWNVYWIWLLKFPLCKLRTFSHVSSCIIMQDLVNFTYHCLSGAPQVSSWQEVIWKRRAAPTMTGTKSSIYSMGMLSIAVCEHICSFNSVSVLSLILPGGTRRCEQMYFPLWVQKTHLAPRDSWNSYTATVKWKARLPLASVRRQIVHAHRCV